MTSAAAYIALLREMVRIPSPSFNEDALASFLFRQLEDMGLAPQRIGNNILCFPANVRSDMPTLVLDAHIDTVQPSEGYTRDPFDPGMQEDVVFGLGSNDDGGSVVSMIAAFRHFYDRPLRFNLVLVLTSEEERSGAGGSSLIYSQDGPFGAPDGLPAPEWVIVGEPTGLRAATCEKGLLVIDGKAKGVSAHAAGSDGVNALYLALDDIAALRSHSFSRVSPVSGNTTLNVTQICAGKTHNVIPDECSYTIDVRFTECYTAPELLGELQSLCSGSTLTARKLDNRASATFEGSPLLRAAGRAGLQTYSSPTASDWCRIGCDAIKIGPGESSRSHKADEYILTCEIQKAIETYIKIIEELQNDDSLE